MFIQLEDTILVFTVFFWFYLLDVVEFEDDTSSIDASEGVFEDSVENLPTNTRISVLNKRVHQLQIALSVQSIRHAQEVSKLKGEIDRLQSALQEVSSQQKSSELLYQTASVSPSAQEKNEK